MPNLRELRSANAPKVSLTVWRPWSELGVNTLSLRLQVLTPPSDHGLKRVNETEGALEDVHPRW